MVDYCFSVMFCARFEIWGGSMYRYYADDCGLAYGVVADTDVAHLDASRVQPPHERARLEAALARARVVLLSSAARAL